jgi:predicted regulator of Ras-like GTPase activity (Roadblock/LC7/MglB family)
MLKTTGEKLDAVMQNALNTVSGVEAVAVVSLDGLIMTSALPVDVDESRVAAMTAAILGLGERTAQEMNRGVLDQIYIKGANGYVMILAIGDMAVLTALADKHAKLGLLFVLLKRVAQQIEAVLRE